MSYVVRDRTESFESLLKRFKRTIQEDRLLSEVKRRRFFEKPSQARKRKAAAKLRKSRRTTRKMSERGF